VKAWEYADGHKQRLYKSKEETSSPIISTEGVFIISIVDAYEGQDVATVDVSGAFLHLYIDELIHLQINGAMAELLVCVNPEKYGPFVVTEHGKKVIYVQLVKALYGMLQATLLLF